MTIKKITIKSVIFKKKYQKKTTDIEAEITLQENLRKALDESSIVSVIDPNRKITFVNDQIL